MKHNKFKRNVCLIIAILLVLGFIVPVLISSAATPDYHQVASTTLHQPQGA